MYVWNFPPLKFYNLRMYSYFHAVGCVYGTEAINGTDFVSIILVGYLIEIRIVLHAEDDWFFWRVDHYKITLDMCDTTATLVLLEYSSIAMYAFGYISWLIQDWFKKRESSTRIWISLNLSTSWWHRAWNNRVRNICVEKILLNGSIPILSTNYHAVMDSPSIICPGIAKWRVWVISSTTVYQIQHANSIMKSQFEVRVESRVSQSGTK